MLVWSRALVLATVALLSGAVAHASAGGLLPHPGVLAVMLVGGTVLSARFLAGPASTLRLVALVVGGQGLTHVLLSVTAGHVGDPVRRSVASAPITGGPLQATTVDGRRVGSLADQFDASVAGASGGPGDASISFGWATHLVDHVVAQGPLMVLAHVAGAAALGLWLAVGERALWQLLWLTASRVRMLLAHRAVATALLAAVRGVLAAAGRLRPAHQPVRPLAALLEHPVVSRRGPPALLAA